MPFACSKCFKNMFLDHALRSIDLLSIPLMHGVHYSGQICSSLKIIYIFLFTGKSIINQTGQIGQHF